MNKRLTIILIILFAVVLTFLAEVEELWIIKEYVLPWSVGAVIAATFIGVFARNRKQIT